MKFETEEFYLKSHAEMRALFADHPDACDNTLLIAERCEVGLNFGGSHLPDVNVVRPAFLKLLA